jgi:hypothetical protein
MVTDRACAHKKHRQPAIRITHHATEAAVSWDVLLQALKMVLLSAVTA